MSENIVFKLIKNYVLSPGHAARVKIIGHYYYTNEVWGRDMRRSSHLQSFRYYET